MMASPAKRSGDSPPVEVGDILAGKYRVERVLGVGGMGVVVAAVHVELDELRALKFMLPKVSSDAEAVTRFFREARAVARLKSEYVARIYDIGKLESGLPFMVMEYLEGSDLRTVLKERGPLTVADTVDYTMQALAGLAEAHSVGIVHRDLKPANLFLTTGTDGLPRVKIVDFGISKLIGAAEAKATTEVTQATTLLGSPHYMSPEQLASARFVDSRTDIWSLGIMLFEMLVGRLPFEGPSLTAVTIVVVQNDPGKPSELQPGVPSGLDDVVARCLSKKADGRYRNVAALAAALAPFGSSRARDLAQHVRRVHQAARAAGRNSIAGSRDADRGEPVGAADPLAAVAQEIRASESRRVRPQSDAKAVVAAPPVEAAGPDAADASAGAFEHPEGEPPHEPPRGGDDADAALGAAAQHDELSRSERGTDNPTGSEPLTAPPASAPTADLGEPAMPPSGEPPPTELEAEGLEAEGLEAEGLEAEPAAATAPPATTEPGSTAAAPTRNPIALAVAKCRAVAATAAHKVMAAARRAEPTARRIGPIRVAVAAAVAVGLLLIGVWLRTTSSDEPTADPGAGGATTEPGSETLDGASSTAATDGSSGDETAGVDGAAGNGVPQEGLQNGDAGSADADAEAPAARPRKRGRLPDIYDDTYVPQKKKRPPPNYHGPTTL